MLRNIKRSIAERYGSMSMKINKAILSISVILPILSIFFTPINYDGGIKYGFGLPFNFLLYYSFDFPSNRIEIFKLGNLTKIAFRLDVYVICVIIVYFVLYLTNRFVLKIRSGSFLDLSQGH